MTRYNVVIEDAFHKNVHRYSSMKKQIQRRVDRILEQPYANTEELSDYKGKLNLIGCRSTRIDRNFRIIFVICEECRDVPECEYCLCDERADQTVIFLTVGPHDRAYEMR